MQLAARMSSPHLQHIRENGHGCTSTTREFAQVVAGACKKSDRPAACSARPGGGISASFLINERTLLGALFDAFAFPRSRRTRANVFRMSVSTLLV
jgi:hypothetical protein